MSASRFDASTKRQHRDSARVPASCFRAFAIDLWLGDRRGKRGLDALAVGSLPKEARKHADMSRGFVASADHLSFETPRPSAPLLSACSVRPRSRSASTSRLSATKSFSRMPQTTSLRTTSYPWTRILRNAMICRASVTADARSGSIFINRFRASPTMVAAAQHRNAKGR
jgi:hypothetical protein